MTNTALVIGEKINEVSATFPGGREALLSVGFGILISHLFEGFSDNFKSKYRSFVPFLICFGSSTLAAILDGGNVQSAFVNGMIATVTSYMTHAKAFASEPLPTSFKPEIK